MAPASDVAARLKETPAVRAVRRVWTAPRTGPPVQAVTAAVVLYVALHVLMRHHQPTGGVYAFGPSTLQIQLPFDQSDAARAWRDAGNTGLPDKTENLNVAYYNLMASMIQNAGPTLNPRTIQQGMFNAQGIGGQPNYPKIQFRAPSDYTGIDDDRETYWCATRPSEIDGQAGSYASVDNGKRTDLGQWTPGDPRVFPNGTCI
jgi:hypothetical protein